MSTTKTNSKDAKGKQKMSKAQMQLMMIKKKQCDTIALHIVERLLEPNIDREWVLQNLKHINKCHMEDVIEERTISKLCGYILCDKPLTMDIKQRYFISTKSNKVYDISKRKNFCSSVCYGASNFLLEQLLTSPLWLRDKEDIPHFQLLSKDSECKEAKIGDEVQIKETQVESSLEKPSKKEEVEEGKTEVRKPQKVVQDENKCNQEQLNDESEEETENIVQICHKKERCESLTKTKLLETVDSNNKSESQIYDIQQKTFSELEIKKQENPILKVKEIAKKKSIQKKINDKKIEVNKPSSDSADAFVSLVLRVEQKFKEWVTDNTKNLLLSDEETRKEVLDGYVKSERYTALCQKLNRLQILGEKEDEEKEKIELQPQPHFSSLQEESKKMELKVKAFYKGSITQDSEKTEENDDNLEIVPLTESYAPDVIRRNIFLDKMNKILPDLLSALSSSCGFDPRNLYYKVLINTFSFTSGNIIFRSIEQTLIGLIIIKMLSLIHPEIKVLLTTDKAIKCLSMILMSYKLDQFYLDRFVMSLLE